MMNISHPGQEVKGEVNLPASKSISNRLLILRAVHPEIQIQGLSTADDTKVLEDALINLPKEIDVAHAGTAMRFLTAYLSTVEGKEFILKGSKRMNERPIRHLVEALTALGAQIEYLGKEGFPPLKITGAKPKGGEVEARSDVSSQFISALMLISGKLENGLTVKFGQRPVSYPYIEMTAALMKQAGYKVKLSETGVRCAFSGPDHLSFSVEKDWSAASYFFAILALAQEGELFFPGLSFDSVQGDRGQVKLFKHIGLVFKEKQSGVVAKKVPAMLPGELQFNMLHMPDLAQTFAVCLSALGINYKLTGLSTLRHKETNRLEALKKELAKMGVEVELEEDSIKSRGKIKFSGGTVATYNDHRMAMSFAPLAVLAPIGTENPEVVSKSFPGFWEQIRNLGFDTNNS